MTSLSINPRSTKRGLKTKGQHEKMLNAGGKGGRREWILTSLFFFFSALPRRRVVSQTTGRSKSHRYSLNHKPSWFESWVCRCQPWSNRRLKTGAVPAWPTPSHSQSDLWHAMARTYKDDYISAYSGQHRKSHIGYIWFAMIVHGADSGFKSLCMYDWQQDFTLKVAATISPSYSAIFY